MSVAVIIPCYNVEHHVEAAVRSAWAQTLAPAEVIAVDDGSTDGTPALLARLAIESPGRLQVIIQPNMGANAARNAGVRATRSEFVQFLDADDVLHPDKLAHQVALARAGADVVVGGYRNRYVNGRAEEVVLPWPGDAWEGLVRTRMGTTSANLFARGALLRSGGWDEQLRSSQDYELLFRLMKSGARVVMDMRETCSVLKRERGSISRTGERENWLRYLQLRQAMRDHLRTLDPERYQRVVQVADQHLFMAIRVLSKHDRQAAFAAFDRCIPMGFVPEFNKAVSRSYLGLYRLFGFRMAERAAAIFSLLKG